MFSGRDSFVYFMNLLITILNMKKLHAFLTNKIDLSKKKQLVIPGGLLYNKCIL